MLHRLDFPDMNAKFSPCAIVPTHNHWQALAGVVAGLRQHGLPVFIVDDGSHALAAAAIAALHQPQAEIQVVRRPINGGKGAAVMEGFRLAQAAGYSHVVQVDADGQHDLGALACCSKPRQTHRLWSAEPPNTTIPFPVGAKSVVGSPMCGCS